jgi:endonuclease YncB( thermonuclease family)
MHLIRSLAVAILFAIASVPLHAQQRPAAPRSCTVQRIVDGDTLVCQNTRIRLLLIDAPESGHEDFGLRAKLALEEMAPVGTRIRLEYDVQTHDRYGRPLAHIHTDRGLWLNLEMVRRGYAHVSVYPPNVRHVEQLRAAERKAREHSAGLWATTAFTCKPVDFRRGRCH